MLLRTAAVSIGILAALTGAAAVSRAASAASAGSVQTTEKRVQGIITAVEATSLTIASTRRQTITGKIDPKKTKILVDGKPSKTADLQITYTAKAELGLDDVWVTVSADSTP